MGITLPTVIILWTTRLGHKLRRMNMTIGKGARGKFWTKRRKNRESVISRSTGCQIRRAFTHGSRAATKWVTRPRTARNMDMTFWVQATNWNFPPAIEPNRNGTR